MVDCRCAFISSLHKLVHGALYDTKGPPVLMMSAHNLLDGTKGHCNCVLNADSSLEAALEELIAKCHFPHIVERV